MPVLSNDEFANFGASSASPQVLSHDDFENAKPPAASTAPQPMGWADVGKQALSNAGPSAVQFAKNMAQPVLHPLDTLSNVKDLGLGLLEKGAQAGILPNVPQFSFGEKSHAPQADAVGKFFADRYGGLENVKKTMATDPVGFLGDLSTVLTGGETALGRLPGVLGKAGAAAGTAGRIVDPVSAAGTVTSLAGQGAGWFGKRGLGLSTGAGADAIETAASAGYHGGQAGEAFRANMRGQESAEETVDEARRAVTQLRQERGAAYRADMTKIGADTTVLDFNKIDNAVAKAQDVKTYRGQSGTSQAQSLSPKTQAIRTEMEDAIDSWRNLYPAEFHTPEGIDALKQQLGDIRDSTPYGTPERVAANHIYGAVRQTIIDQVPAYAKTMKAYEEASNQIKEIERTLSLNPNASIDTALRKLQSVLRNNVSTNYGRRAELTNFLVNAGAPHLMQRLSGQALSSWEPRGLNRMLAAGAMETIPTMLGFGHAGLAGAGLAALAAAPALATMSPRLVGEAVHGAARVARGVPYISGAISPFMRPARQIGQLQNAVPSPFQQPMTTPFSQ